MSDITSAYYIGRMNKRSIDEKITLKYKTQLEQNVNISRNVEADSLQCMRQYDELKT